MCPGLRQCVPDLSKEAHEFLELEMEEQLEQEIQGQQDGNAELETSLALYRSSVEVVDTLTRRLVRPIIVPSHQTSALPDWPSLDAAISYATQARIPFDLLAIDYDAPGLDYEIADDTIRLLAAIVERIGPGLRITPLALGPAKIKPRAVRALLSTVWTSEPYSKAPGEIVVSEHSVQSQSDHTPDRGPDLIDKMTHLSVALSDRVLMALRLIESVNVNLVTAAIPRMIRRHHKGPLHVPQLVTIRETRRVRQVEEPEDSHRRLKMRHEVRGHFKHYPGGTPIFEANPELVIWHPERGEVVQVWCPPFVAGPANAPLRLSVWKLDGYVDTEY
jgi:hypothetical protein